MNNHFWIVSGVTFCVFFTEALIHYNYGILESKALPFNISNFTVPKGASALSGIIINRMEQKA